MPYPPLLAHAGAGSTWQAMLVVASLGLVVVVVLALIGRIELAAPDDLVLPLAVLAVVSSIAAMLDQWLSDWIGWAFPVGVVALVVLLLGALTPLRLAPDGLLPYVGLGLAVAGAVTLHGPLAAAWHPAAEVLPDARGASLSILSPDDGATLPAGEATVEVATEGASIADRRVAESELPDPATRAGVLSVTVGGDPVEVRMEDDCPPSSPCERAEVAVPLSAGEEVGLRVELLRGDGVPFAPAVSDRVELTVE